MFNIIQIPVADMREKPMREARVVSQALFSESVEIKKQEKGWVLIATADGYLGWVLEEVIARRKEPYQGDGEVSRLSAHLYRVKDTEFGPVLTLAFGARLKILDSDARWHRVALPDEREAFIQKGDLNKEPFELISFCKKFLGLPYTWGGRSSFGFDCSGFVQMVYGRMGFSLPRDAREQIFVGKPISFEELRLGDLLFWGPTQEKIKHVGLSFGDSEFIHATSRENKPYLRISDLKDREWCGALENEYSFRAARRISL